MSSDFAVEVRGLAKEYVIGEPGFGVSTLRDELSALTRRLARRDERRSRGARQRIWALDDVGFDVERGKAVGVIGHNGAGKTTLLKILSRITAPTRGEVRVHGHVGSLLEVGTGFHPELTGRDNVFLNGAILGMRRTEIRRKFDEIVAFAEIEQFIDTPVKRYSSGMYVRLAFAVAAHLEPDILIVDEVLAVGDQSFQRKCLGKMDEVTTQGRTVLFVSHNLAAIRTLTSRSIWLDHGKVMQNGATGEVVSNYLSSISGAVEGAAADLTAEGPRRGVTKPTEERVRFASIALVDAEGQPLKRLQQWTPLRFELGLDVREPIRFLELYLRVKTTDGMRVFSSFSGQTDEALTPGRYTAVCEFPENPLSPGRYVVELLARGANLQDMVPSALAFEVDVGETEDDNVRYATGWSGVVRLPSQWGALEPAHGASARAEHAPAAG